MSAITSQITSLTIVYSTVYSDADQRKHQSSASLTFVRGIHRGPVNSPHKWPVTRKMFPFDDVIMSLFNCNGTPRVVMVPILSSLVTPKAVITTTSDATSDDKVITTTPGVISDKQGWRHHHDNSLLSLCLTWLQHRHLPSSVILYIRAAKLYIL